MKSFVIALALSCALLSVAGAQSAPPAQQAAGSAAYAPDLGDLMSTTQLRHFKLWFAGNIKNWPLADYELTAIRKSFEAAAAMYPKLDSVSQKRLIEEVSYPALDEIAKAIKAKNATAFSKSFEKLTGACNDCHKETRVPFIVIRTPTSSPFSNQSFAPAP